MKVHTRVCDICGNETLIRRKHAYVLKRKLCFIDSTFKKMDICEDCYKNMEKYIKKVKQNNN